MADYQQQLPAFDERGALVVALSTDDAAATSELTAKLELSYPLLHGADPREVAARTGAYFDERGFLHATAFVLKPDGTVALAVYSSGSRGRLIAEDALVVIDGGRRT